MRLQFIVNAVFQNMHSVTLSYLTNITGRAAQVSRGSDWRSKGAGTERREAGIWGRKGEEKGRRADGGGASVLLFPDDRSKNLLDPPLLFKTAR